MPTICTSVRAWAALRNPSTWPWTSPAMASLRGAPWGELHGRPGQGNGSKQRRHKPDVPWRALYRRRCRAGASRDEIERHETLSPRVLLLMFAVLPPASRSARLSAGSGQGARSPAPGSSTSNRHAQVLLDVIARFAPEGAGQVGVSGLDREMTEPHAGVAAAANGRRPQPRWPSLQALLDSREESARPPGSRHSRPTPRNGSVRSLDLQRRPPSSPMST